MLIPPELLEKMRREREEQKRSSLLELPLPCPDMIYPVRDSNRQEPEESTARVIIIEM